jgi:hypothetical protein
VARAWRARLPVEERREPRAGSGRAPTVDGRRAEHRADRPRGRARRRRRPGSPVAQYGGPAAGAEPVGGAEWQSLRQTAAKTDDFRENDAVVPGRQAYAITDRGHPGAPGDLHREAANAGECPLDARWQEVGYRRPATLNYFRERCFVH